ncbi:MAG TPA: DUF2231 domain-containing protein [Anaerolineales bacterium]|nr:DUF2231 domain-containing protein [Anaerolineales bacterium]
MESKTKLFGHAIHPMLVVFPLGLLATAVIFDILYLSTANTAFPTASFYMIITGIIGGLLAAIFGFIDWLALPNNSRAKNIGLWHGLGNVVIVVLFALSWLLRRDNLSFVPDSLALILSFAGVVLALFTWWIGGELVYRLGVAVDPGANVNAPSSLSEKTPATSSTSSIRGTTTRR